MQFYLNLTANWFISKGIKGKTFYMDLPKFGKIFIHQTAFTIIAFWALSPDRFILVFIIT
jgi:hypothetical protein